MKWRKTHMRKSENINTLLALSEQGDQKARIQLCNKLGMMYYHGHDGVEQNYEEAAKYFQAADDKNMLGECYLHGLGVEPNIEKTIELWEKACEEHCRYYDVMFKLAHLYGDGIEMEPDYEKARYWWRSLAENDEGVFGQLGAFPQAMYQLACYYYEGKGVKKDLKQALKYFRYTIDLFTQMEWIYYKEYDREQYTIKNYFREKHGNITISDEPDFIIHARKILVKNGYKSAINKIINDAQKGDKRAAEILKEFGIPFDA